MLLEVQRPHLSIRGTIADGPISDFAVISGVNGSGKSQLFQSIANGSTLVDGIEEQAGTKIFSLNQLIPTSGGSQAPSQFRDVWSRIKPVVDGIAQQFGFPTDPMAIDASADQFATTLASNLNMPAESLLKIQEASGKVIAKFTSEDYRRYFPLHASVNDLFQFSITDVFLTYSERLRENRFNKFLDQCEGEPTDWLSSEDFEARYGGPPWDLLNDVLQTMGLPYRFLTPLNLPADLPYEVLLTDPQSDNRELKVADLSTGEQVLLALALGLYAGQHLQSSTLRPRLLLLDEADASLHPSMIQNLLTVTEQILHKRHGVRIMLATHSPTTVALAPPDSLYLMSRAANPRLKKIERDAALSSLTVGLPTLSVRNDQRRQVLVESHKDEEYYTTVYSIVRDSIGSPFSLQFLASGAKGAGNRQAVEELVQNLRSRGNDLVFGLVDRDTSTTTPKYVVLSAERYSIENYLLDPLVLGCFLLRSQLKTPEDFGLPKGVFHFNIGEEHAQAIIDSVSDDLRVTREPATTVRYHGGFSASVPNYFLEHQGHALEKVVRDKYPAFHSQRKILTEITSQVMAEVSQVIPHQLVDLFSRLVELPQEDKTAT